MNTWDHDGFSESSFWVRNQFTETENLSGCYEIVQATAVPERQR